VIPYVKLDGQYKFFLPTIREWLHENTVMPQTDSDPGRPERISNNIWNSKVGV
jgi:hypothetical protein